jgi:formylglycine-generating enzyme required for sulfatase activity
MFIDMTRPATVSSFRLDRYEVTVGRFRQFVIAGSGTQGSPPARGAGARADLADSGWDPAWNIHLPADAAALAAAVKCDPIYQTWTNLPAANENRPIVCLTWYEAFAFCAWDGGFLPTEAEWHYAASGGSAQRAYPWSSAPGDLAIDCSRAIYDPALYCVSGGTSDVGATSPAGDGMWGHADLAGNASEWSLDWWYPNYTTPCSDCAGLFPASLRVIRGGGYSDDAKTVRAAFHGSLDPANRNSSVGVRCARTL